MVTAIVLAAGKGSRMKTKTAKQFLNICGKPLIYYALKTFQESSVDEIVLVTGEEDISYCKTYIIEENHFIKVKKIVAGGENRFDSVYNGIKAADEKSDIIMIHDGARPFVSCEIIEKCIEETKKYKACTVAVPVKDTIKVVDKDMMGINTPDRSRLYQIQTPQTFERKLIEDAYAKMYESGDKDITDDTMIVERYAGKTVKVLEGSYKNIKVTTKEDLLIAECFLKSE